MSSIKNIERKYMQKIRMNTEYRNKFFNRIKDGVAKGYSAQNITESYIDEYDRICNSQARDKEEYKAQCEHEHNDYINACLE